ncbi:MAG: SPOR domain-containing protein [Alphaproteobacteria bacterium]|nr:SPOR domain-containing protein [Alphaproteobacteria bacterium]
MSAAEKTGRRFGDRGWLLVVGAVSVALAGFGGVLWYAYSVGNQDNGAPLLNADATLIKVKPVTPVGLPPQALEREIYKLQRPAAPGQVERVLPPPETPLARPAPPLPGPVETQLAAPPSPLARIPAETPPAVPNTAPRSSPALDKLIEGILKDEPAAGPAPSTVSPKPTAALPAVTEASPPAAPPRQIAQVPTRPGAFSVQLVLLQTEEAARQAWTKARTSYADLLSGLEGTVTPATLPDKRVVWRVQVGPLASRDAADTLCGALRARKSTCLVLAP